jgi:hypothetical protein
MLSSIISFYFHLFIICFLEVRWNALPRFIGASPSLSAAADGTSCVKFFLMGISKIYGVLG